MPISEEDEYEKRSFYEPSSTMSKAELRKTHKPIMEKKRRARINHCLNEIKSLILEAMKKDPARHSKLEKADILEMAVKHLQNVRKQQLTIAMASDPSLLRKFKSGFDECAQEVKDFVSKFENVNAALRQRICTHLSESIGGIERIVRSNYSGYSSTPSFLGTDLFASSSPPRPKQGEDDNDSDVGGLHLIPGRLPSGELALLFPDSSYLRSTSIAKRNARPSAFVTVIPSSLLSQPRYYDKASATVTSDSNPRGSSPSKLGSQTLQEAPLTIITNRAERFKSAQLVRESADSEENVPRREPKYAREEGGGGEGLLMVAGGAVSAASDRTDSAATASSSMWRPW